MKRRIALIIALNLLAALVVAPAALAKDKGYDSKYNHAEYWEARYGYECTKDDTERGSSWTSDGAFAVVILKSSGDNDVFEGVWYSETLRTTSGKDISHIITCIGDEEIPH